jgi:hypothetical protein
MRLVITAHAAERFRERHEPDLSLEQAYARLRYLAGHARRLGRAPGHQGGHQVMLDEQRGVVGVIVEERGDRVLVTCIPRQEIETVGDADPWEESA